ncbi:MAG: hypothetical protein JO061_11400 [Acidobacteriaceae bacterium]|nr:hypothetical protein [Acidobacteriaceae bacterium]
MSIRNIMWTALPNGFTAAGNKLRLSVYVSPRLVTNNGVDGELSQFPDFLNWPKTIGPIKFNVQIQGGPSFTVSRNAATPLAPKLWTSLFQPTTYVRSYQLPDKTNLNIRSYPIRKVHSFLKGAYQAVAIQAPDQPPTRGQLNFEDTRKKVITNLVPISIVQPQEEQDINERLNRELSGRGLRAIPSDFGDSTTDFYQVRLFHQFLSKRLADGSPAPLPPQKLPKLDFHDALSRLSQYPELERRLGIVVDLVIPANIPASGNIQVVPVLSAPPPMTPWTAYQLDSATKSFLPAPGASSDVADGMLQLTEDNFDLIQVDIDGAAHKMLDFAFNLGYLDFVTRTAGSAQEFGFPSLRSAGFAVTRVNRAVNLHKRLVSAVQQNTSINASPQGGPVLTAEDVTRGYRIDVWDSMSSKWHSLCWRDGTYDFTRDAIVRQLAPDEGFISLATTQSADGTTTDLYLPESLFRWAGWSLSVPRIGKTIGPNDTAIQPGNPAQTEFKLVVTFKPVKHTLPRLRFGASYQIRARAVDLAGNSLPPHASIPASFSIPPQPVPYLRYEPIVAPVVVLRQPLSPETSPGASMQTLAIRSNYNTPATSGSERHLAPPKVSEEFAEVHGMFDTPTGLDKAIYPTLVAKDGDFGMDPAHPDQPVPHPEAQLELPYLPDPLAVGAAFLNLPQTVAGTVFKVPFSGKWPDKLAFRISLVEGSATPSFSQSATERVLTVELQKADQVQVLMSCYPTPNGLSKMALWEWIAEAKPPNLSQLEQLALNGRHWMLTPPKTLLLVHAVRQPLIQPEFQSLQSTRVLGGTTATLTDEIVISGKSTIKVDVQAAWTDVIDDGTNSPQPKTPPGSARAFEIPVSPADTLLAINGQHEFHDTKYRSVTYAAVATSLFREYFPNSLTRPASDFTRESTPVTLDILNTARPKAPKVLYVVPTFGWDQKQEGTWHFSTRAGGGVRVYLGRPWFTSGAGELLGVVLWQCSPPQHATFAPFETPDFLKPFVTQWGMDPIWDAPPLPSEATPLLDSFRNAAKKEMGLTLDELSQTPDLAFAVAGHTVGYDNERKLWYCDIEIDFGTAYFPFIRLALARYQPNSLPDAHLSRVVLADFVQLVPNRSASIAFDGFDRKLLNLAISGLTFNQMPQPTVQVTVEAQPPGSKGDLAWIPVSTPMVLTATDGPGGVTLWATPITLPAPRGSRPFRLRIEEFETYQTGTDDQTQTRLVYADVIPL